MRGATAPASTGCCVSLVTMDKEERESTNVTFKLPNRETLNDPVDLFFTTVTFVAPALGHRLREQ